MGKKARVQTPGLTMDLISSNEEISYLAVPASKVYCTTRLVLIVDSKSIVTNSICFLQVTVQYISMQCRNLQSASIPAACSSMTCCSFRPGTVGSVAKTNGELKSDSFALWPVEAVKGTKKLDFPKWTVKLLRYHVFYSIQCKSRIVCRCAPSALGRNGPKPPSLRE